MLRSLANLVPVSSASARFGRVAVLVSAAVAAAGSACPAAADDLPPWMQPAPQPAGASAPAGTSAPAAGAVPATEAATFGELLAILLKPEDADRLRRDSEEQRAAWLASQWAALPAHQQAQIAFAGERLRENGVVANPRSLTLLVLGPPQAMHSEAARDWTGKSVEDIADLAALAARLRAGKAPAGATSRTLAGAMPTELWVYAGESLNDVRVVTFVDDGADGSFSFAEDRLLPVNPPPSAAPAVEPPAGLFPPIEAAAGLAALPVLARQGLPLTTSQEFFKASAGRTFTRFLVSVDPLDIEMELSGDPAVYGQSAEAYVRVEQAGTAIWQESMTLAAANATASSPWLLDLSVPLPPGKYQATALVKDAALAGGSKTWEVEVPAFSGPLTLSSPVVALAVDGSLPRAEGAAEDKLLPFQIGNYIVRPVPGAQFKRGQSAAFVVQVYGDVQGATIEYDLYNEGVYQSSLEPTRIQSLPSTQITIQDISKVFPDGSYQLRVTVKNPKDDSQSASVAIPFRVRG